MVNPKSVKKCHTQLLEIRAQIEAWIAAKEQSQELEESKPCPSEDRLDAYESQVSALQAALEGIDTAIDELDGYE